MARIVGKMPNKQEIDAACSDAIRAYKRYEFERIVLLFGLVALIGSALLFLSRFLH